MTSESGGGPAEKLNEARFLQKVISWDALLSWDFVGIVVPGVFLAVGVGFLGVDWFPHNLLISQLGFGIGTVILLVKIIVSYAHSPRQNRGRTTSVALGSLTLLTVAIWVIWAVQVHKVAPKEQATPNPGEAPTFAHGKGPIRLDYLDVLGEVQVGKPFGVAINLTNTSGETLTVKSAAVESIMQLPADPAKRATYEEELWHMVEMTEQGTGTQHQISTFQGGEFNLKRYLPPLSAAEVKLLSDGSHAAYFLQIIDDKISNKRLLELCVHVGPSRVMTYCYKHNSQ